MNFVYLGFGLGVIIVCFVIYKEYKKRNEPPKSENA